MSIVTWNNGTLILNDNSYRIATIGKTVGKWYWEVSPNQGRAAFGIASSNAISYISNPSNLIENRYNLYWSNGNYTSFECAASQGTVYGFTLDMDNHEFKFTKDGINFILITNDFSKYIDKVYPFITSTRDGTDLSNNYIVNFGATSFRYKIPKGYISFDENQLNIYYKYLIQDGTRIKTTSDGINLIDLGTIYDENIFNTYGMNNLSLLNKETISKIYNNEYKILMYKV